MLMFSFSLFKLMLWICLPPCAPPAANPRHPVYLSKTEIRYDRQNQNLNVVLKVFSDDWQNALSVWKGKNVEIGTDREPSDLDALLEEYLRARFNLKTDGQTRAWTYKGRRQDEDDMFATLIFLQTKDTPPFASLDVHNSILHEYINNQENIVVVQYAGEYRRASLRKNQAEASFDFR